MPLSIRVEILAGLAAGLAVLGQPVLAQKPVSPPIGGGGGAPGATNASHPGPGLPQPPPGPLANPAGMGIYLSGKVVMEDGTPPPDPVTIERVCNGLARAQAYTDQKGRFAFQMGQNTGVMQDASEDGRFSQGGQAPSQTSSAGGSGLEQSSTPDFRFANCELRAMFAGFRSDTVNLTGRHFLDDPDVGTLVLHRLGNVEGTVVSLTSLAAPKDARRAYERARAALQKAKLAEAAKDLRKAVDIYPKYAAAWYELGRIQEQNQEIADARNSYLKALEADARFMSPYVQLAGLAVKAGNWREVADATDRLLQLDAVDYEVAFTYNAIAYLNLGRLSEAEKSARTAEKLDTLHRYPKRVQLLAVILARKGDYAGAVAYTRQYLEWAPEAADASQMKARLGELERLADQKQQAQNVASSTEHPAASGPRVPPQ